MASTPNEMPGERAPILPSLIADWKPILQTFGIVAMTNAAYYLTFTFAVEKRKAESTDFQLINTLALVVVLACKLFGGECLRCAA